MSVVGVDFGAANTVIAVARNRGVDVVSAHNKYRLLQPLSRLMNVTDYK